MRISNRVQRRNRSGRQFLEVALNIKSEIDDIAILNFVGLLTGPRRGCFASMLLVFVVLPIVLLVILTIAGIPVIEEIVQAFEEFVESY